MALMGHHRVHVSTDNQQHHTCAASPNPLPRPLPGRTAPTAAGRMSAGRPLSRAIAPPRPPGEPPKAAPRPGCIPPGRGWPLPPAACGLGCMPAAAAGGRCAAACATAAVGAEPRPPRPAMKPGADADAPADRGPPRPGAGLAGRPGCMAGWDGEEEAAAGLLAMGRALGGARPKRPPIMGCGC
jgi:hypothetical protein